MTVILKLITTLTMSFLLVSCSTIDANSRATSEKSKSTYEKSKLDPRANSLISAIGFTAMILFTLSKVE